jgi:hypothetical protein
MRAVHGVGVMQKKEFVTQVRRLAGLVQSKLEELAAIGATNTINTRLQRPDKQYVLQDKVPQNICSMSTETRSTKLREFIRLYHEDKKERTFK